jgi:lantibiotic modifying enzyme
MRITRRALLQASSLLAACATPARRDPDRPAPRPNLAAAQEIARWLGTAAQPTEAGVTWPADPGQPKRLDPGLYSGAAGVVLFFVELHRTTGDAAALSLVRRGADDLATRVPEDPAPHLFGLYPGNEGIAIALFEAYGVTGDERHRQAALRILGLVRDKARATDGEGVAWNDSYDVMSGIAGTGLFLLWAARAFGRPDAVALAARAGAALLALGRPDGDGLKWQLGAGSSRLMPNFSHGTAGVSYFLASLYLETRQARFLEGAQAGARYLQRVEHDGLVFHYEPGGEDRYYLAWCHGPCGTGRLYHRLWQITGEPRWREAVARGGRALLASGIPERRSSGFWNNIGQCCGSAGVAEYALHLAHFLNDDGYRRLTERMTADLLARGTRDGTGLRFVQAEYRIQPTLLVAQTGWMQGAAGVGSLLLRLDAEISGRRINVELPDCPFPRTPPGRSG